MGWPASVVVGVLTALATMVAAGYVANLAAGWHHMSSFEGKSGYFVVGMALVGLILGLGIGLAARVIREMGGFLRLAQKTGKRLPRLSIDTEVRKPPALATSLRR